MDSSEKVPTLRDFVSVGNPTDVSSTTSTEKTRNSLRNPESKAPSSSTLMTYATSLDLDSLMPQFPMGPSRDPVGGRLSKFLPTWKIITTDHWILRVIGEGYCLAFDELPPLITHMEGNRFWLSGPKLASALTAIDKLLLKRAVRELPVEDPGFGFYSPVFLVPKKDSPEPRIPEKTSQISYGINQAFASVHSTL